MVWAPSTSGIFSLSSAWELVRGRSNIFALSKFYWHKVYPTKESVFLWRLLHRALPTDSAIGRKGIYIVSKCICGTTNNQIECAAHLLLGSEIARQVWQRICFLMEEPQQTLSITQLLQTWWQKSSIDSTKDWLHIMLPGITVWFIWKSRNKIFLRIRIWIVQLLLRE